jgi:hypothetical protein
MSHAQPASEGSILSLNARYRNDINGGFSAPLSDMHFVNTRPIDALVIGKPSLHISRR